MLHWVVVLFIFSIVSALSGQEEVSALAGELAVVFLIMFVILFIIAAVFARNEDTNRSNF
ncbi:MAG: hypothetical protein KC478_07810 [Bacteriovoracaceae bacterium]|nr:hypothetical protein [Bacteriovoracaceae bacterium]